MPESVPVTDIHNSKVAGVQILQHGLYLLHIVVVMQPLVQLFQRELFRGLDWLDRVQSCWAWLPSVINVSSPRSPCWSEVSTRGASRSPAAITFRKVSMYPSGFRISLSRLAPVRVVEHDVERECVRHPLKIPSPVRPPPTIHWFDSSHCPLLCPCFFSFSHAMWLA